MTNALLERMPAGFAGDVTRKHEATLEPALLGTVPIPYGAPAVYRNGKLAPVTAGDTLIAGFLARPYPTQSGADGTAPAATLGDVLRRGYMNVRLALGTAAHNGQVYVRLVAASGKTVGDIEAAADGDNTLSITGCVFTGPADASGIIEIAYNL